MPRSFAYPVYQIDFAAVQAGKRLSATKRRIRWRFGFPNQQALAAGRTGTECRGEEHEIVIVWSVTSGKRQILMDGREVHFSANRVGLIDVSWSMAGNHVLKTVCHAAPPLSPTPGFRQYDFFIDGLSFFNMPKVFELGVKGASADDNRIPGHPGSFNGMASPRSVFSEAAGGYSNAYNGPVGAPRTQSEEDELLQKAIQASLAESKNHLGEATAAASVATSASADAADLLDFGNDSAPEPPASYSAPYGAAPAPAYAAAPAPAYSSPSYGAPAYGAAAYGASNGYGPPAYAGATSYAPAGPPQPLLALPPSTNSYGGGPPPPQPPTPTESYSGQSASYRAPPPAAAYSQPSSYGASSPAYGGSQASYGAPPPAYGGAPAYGAPPPAYGGAPAYGAPSQTYGGPPPPANYGAPNPYASTDPFAPKTPSHDNVASDILKAYGSTPSPGQYQPAQLFSGSNGSAHHYEEAPPMNPALSFSMNALTITEKEEKPQNPFEAAMKKLVNVDNIDQPAEEQLKLTLKKEEENRSVKNKNRSVPLPPAGKKVLGSGATLKDIAKVKPPPKTESVMKPPVNLYHGDPAMAGALVVHGQGPPPLQPQGFGVVHMQGRMPSAYYGGAPQYR